MGETLQDGVTCLNCKKKMESVYEGKLFASVLVCQDCYLLAELTYKSSEKELKALLGVLKELLREALVTGKLRPVRPGGRTPSRVEVLRGILQLQEQHGHRRNVQAEVSPPGLPGGSPEVSSSGDGSSRG